MKALKYVSIILIVMIIMTACGQNTEKIDDVIDEEVVVEQLPADGGTLVLSSTIPKTLNPLFNRNEDIYQIHHLIYESLVTFDENMHIEPLLAQKWEFSNGGNSIDFTIKQGIKWHDGVPLTVEDIVFTVNVIKGNIKGVANQSIYKQTLQSIKDVEKLDNNTIRFNLTKDVANILEIVTFPILPSHVFSENQIQLMNQNDFLIVGTGMYKLNEYDNMRNIGLIRNENYWGKKPYIENINISIVPDEEAQLSLFENGDIGFIYPKVVDWGKYADDRRIRSSEFVTPIYEFVGVNFRKSILQDKNIRKAIAYSIDREKISDNIYFGHTTVVDFPVLPNSWLYDEGKIELGYNSNTANALLEEAGYILDENIGDRKDDKGEILKLKLLTNSNNPLREQTALLIQDDLKKVGIQLDVEFLEWDELQKQINTGNYDLVLAGWEFSYVPDLSSALHSSAIGSTNFIAYSNEELDAMLDSSLSNANDTLRKQNWSQIEEHIVAELPYISLFFRNGSVLVDKKVKGEIKSGSYNIFSNIENWYINMEK